MNKSTITPEAYEPSREHIEWAKNHFHSLKDGDAWGISYYCGLLYHKSGQTLQLFSRATAQDSSNPDQCQVELDREQDRCHALNKVLFGRIGVEVLDLAEPERKVKMPFSESFNLQTVSGPLPGLLKTTGEIIPVKPTDPAKGFELKQLYQLLGCELVEVTDLRNGLILIIDEEGKFKPNDINENATLLAKNVIGTFDHIVGPALLCKKTDFK